MIDGSAEVVTGTDPASNEDLFALQRLAGIKADLQSGDPERLIRAARDSLDLAREHSTLSGINDVVKEAVEMADAHQVQSFWVKDDSLSEGGIEYHRTDEQLLNERNARDIILKLIRDGRSSREIKAQSVAIAYPTQIEVIRDGVEHALTAAKQVTSLDWRTDTINPSAIDALRSLLVAPPRTGSYGELTSVETRFTSEQKRTGIIKPTAGMDKEHAVRDQFARGEASRERSLTLNDAFTHYLHGTQNQNSQHQYITSLQSGWLEKMDEEVKNVALGEYIAIYRNWMRDIYASKTLNVDIVARLTNRGNIKQDEYQKVALSGFALRDGSYMKRNERALLAEGNADVLAYLMRKHYENLGINLDDPLSKILEVAEAALKSKAAAVKHAEVTPL